MFSMQVTLFIVAGYGLAIIVRPKQFINISKLSYYVFGKDLDLVVNYFLDKEWLFKGLFLEGNPHMLLDMSLTRKVTKM